MDKNKNKYKKATKNKDQVERKTSLLNQMKNIVLVDKNANDNNNDILKVDGIDDFITISSTSYSTD